jgi:hypothetical protein
MWYIKKSNQVIMELFGVLIEEEKLGTEQNRSGVQRQRLLRYVAAPG